MNPASSFRATSTDSYYTEIDLRRLEAETRRRLDRAGVAVDWAKLAPG